MTSADTIRDDAPGVSEILRALDRMLASELFRGSPQLGAFLRFVVEAALRGESDRLKGYTIGVEALGRGEGFDPQLDPIVRVEATRLRRTIERYYAGPGADESVVIELLRGSYVPAFRRRAIEASAAAPLTNANGRFAGVSRWRLALIPLAALLVVAALAVATVAWRFHYRQADSPVAVQPGGGGTRTAGNGMPTLAVEPFETAGAPGPQAISPSALSGKLRDAFARFEAINILAQPPAKEPPEAAQGANTAPAPDAIDYRLGGLIEYHADRSTSVRVRLLEVGSRRVVWSRTLPHLQAKEDRTDIEEAIVAELATALLNPWGVIRSRERVRLMSTQNGDPRYRCILEASEAFRSADPAHMQSARTCLERQTEANPNFAIGFAYLGGIYAREFTLGYESRDDSTPPLDRALRAARRAVELSPESSRAYMILFTILFVRREIPAAFAAGDKAMALNSYDPSIDSEYGGRLIMIGEVERGLQMLRRASGRYSILPSWHHFYMFLGSYLQDDLASARYHAAQITSEYYQFGHVARALAAHADGDQERARQSLERLILLRPAWRDNARGELARTIPAETIVDRLAGDLAKAGLGADP